MEQWIQQTLSADQFGFAAFLAVFLLGILGSVTSCCTLPVLGAVTGYAGTLDTQNGRRDLLLVGLFFMLGTVLSLAALGAFAGFVSQMASESLGRYWRFVTGLLLVFFGLISLNLVHFRMPKMGFGNRLMGKGVASATLFGLALGGAATACSIGCSPLLPVALGATMLNGTTLMGAITLAVFAIGYSLPLAAGIVGIGFGLSRLEKITQRAMPAIRIGAGVLLVGVGFYLLATIS